MRKRLSAHDWTAAALDALAAGGVGAVAVEPLAARLGTTKGSFYWHFANRDALLDAALREWERVATEDVIAVVDAEPDVPRRLRRLLATALRDDRTATIELALQAAAEHALVGPALRRVTARRLEYLDACFVTLGFDPPAARARSLLAYSAFLGHAQLRRAAPAVPPDGAELTAYIDTSVALLCRQDSNL